MNILKLDNYYQNMILLYNSVLISLKELSNIVILKMKYIIYSI